MASAAGTTRPDTDWSAADEFAELQREPGFADQPEFLRALRADALRRFDRLGVPGRRHESWRFNDLGVVTGGIFNRAAEPSPVDAARLPPALDDAAARLCFIDGHYAPGLSRVDSATLPAGVQVLSLSEALRRFPDKLAAHLDRLPGLREQPFAALNSVFVNDGAVIIADAGARCERPLQLCYYSSDGARSYPRALALLGAGAALTLVEEFTGDGAALCCPLTELDLGESAALNYYRLQQSGIGGAHLGALRLRLGAAGRVDAHLLSAGGTLNRVDVFARLDGVDADCGLRGLSLVEDGEQSDYHVHVDHAEPRGRSRQVFRGVLDGRSRAVFDGLIAVAQDAQKTRAEQNNRNLLLSKRALANSNPRLEILADDVQCAHGSTVGFIDPNALFYLRSRGLPVAAARAVLVYAFANEQIEAMALTALRERLTALLAERFRSSGLLQEDQEQQ